MPALIGINAANATSRSMESSKKPITREAMKAVTKLIASQTHRFLTLFRTGANKSSSSHGAQVHLRMCLVFSIITKQMFTPLQTKVPCGFYPYADPTERLRNPSAKTAVRRIVDGKSRAAA